MKDSSDSSINRLMRVRSILETPILDEHKWAKVPHIPADAILLDMEDSVVSDAKEAARAKVIEYVERPEYFEDKILLARINSITTAWGRDDLYALANTNVKFVVCPKVRKPEEVVEIDRILRAEGSSAHILVVVETAESILNLNEIMQTGLVAGLLFGPADLALDGRFIQQVDGEILEELYCCFPRSKLLLAGAAYDVPVFGIVFLSDLRDLDRFRREASRAVAQGFTGLVTFYPPQVDIINEVFTPSPEEVERARRVVYVTAALSDGPTRVNTANLLAAAHDPAVTTCTLEFWRYQGLLPKAQRNGRQGKPRQRTHLGEVLDQPKALVWLRTKTKDSDILRVGLFFESFPIDTVRVDASIITVLEASPSAIREEVDKRRSPDDAPEEAAWEALGQIGRVLTGKWRANAPPCHGRQRREDREQAMALVIGLVLGEEGSGARLEYDAPNAEPMIGLDRRLPVKFSSHEQFHALPQYAEPVPPGHPTSSCVTRWTYLYLFARTRCRRELAYTKRNAMLRPHNQVGGYPCRGRHGLFVGQR